MNCEISLSRLNLSRFQKSQTENIWLLFQQSVKRSRMCHCVTGLYRDIWRDLVEHNTGGGGLGRRGGHNLHPAPRLRLALGVGGGAGQEAEVQLQIQEDKARQALDDAIKERADVKAKLRASIVELESSLAGALARSLSRVRACAC